MKPLIFIIFIISQIYPSQSRESLLTDIVDEDINITASFDGAKIIIYGAVDKKLYKDTILIINVIYHIISRLKAFICKNNITQTICLTI